MLYIKKYRDLLGVTQQQLADKAEIPLKTIQDWEQTGRSPRDMQRLVPIAEALGCTVDELLGRPAQNYTDSPFVEVPVYMGYTYGMSRYEEWGEWGFLVPRPAVDKAGGVHDLGCFMLEVDNDTIDRIVPKGAYILVDPSDRKVEDGMVYALFIGKHGYTSAEFWRVRKLDDGYELLPYSTNAGLHAKKHYDGTDEAVTILGAAVWYAMGPDSELSGFVRPLGLDAAHGCADLPKGAIIPRPVNTVLVPVYGRIAAGEPIEMLEAIDEVDAPVTKRAQYPYSYFLIVEGDSMNREVLGGSYVLIDPNAEVHNGDTVAVNVNGFDATLKVWHRTSNSVILSPNSTNPEHKDIVIDETSPDAPNLRVLGKMVWAMYPY